jgi:hypothetical protein
LAAIVGFRQGGGEPVKIEKVEPVQVTMMVIKAA